MTRRVILEDYLPVPGDLLRLVSGKANEHRIRMTDLISDLQLMENVYTRVFENDSLSPTKRDEVLRRLSDSLAAIEKRIQEDSNEDRQVDKSKANSNLIMSIIAAIFATLFGVLVSVLPNLNSNLNTSESIPIAIGVVVGSALVIGSIWLFLRIRENQISPK